jgi:hypothetical protein
VLERVLSPRAAVALFVLALVGLCSGWALLLSLEREPGPGEPEPFARARTVPASVARLYTGDTACKGCHPKAFAEHAASRHAATLRPVRHDRGPLPPVERFTDPSSGTEYAFTEQEGRYHLAARSPLGIQQCAVDLVLGSGKSGMTFVSVEGPERIRELRMSYFPRRRAWEVTPGQRAPGADPLGKRHEGEMARRCLACHATRLAATETAPPEPFMGVGCEGCHGPGLPHVLAARAGNPREGIERLAAWDAARLNHLCGECHRSEREIDPLDEAALSQTQRFQPYGLMKSACFQKSGNRLSCLTCHAPHRDAERDPQVYERACRSCHDNSASRCPVNPQNDCVRCHMPPREVTRGVTMADHWIRVVR